MAVKKKKKEKRRVKGGGRKSEKDKIQKVEWDGY